MNWAVDSRRLLDDLSTSVGVNNGDLPRSGGDDIEKLRSSIGFPDAFSGVVAEVCEASCKVLLWAKRGTITAENGMNNANDSTNSANKGTNNSYEG